MVQDGQGRRTRYHLPAEAYSVHKQGSSVHKQGSSVHKQGSSVHKVEPADSELDELFKIAESARQNRRLAPKELESTLLRLCQRHWLTNKQLAVFLERNPDGLRSRFLTPMVEQGLLSLRYPEKLNHAEQAYRIRENTSSSVEEK